MDEIATTRTPKSPQRGTQWLDFRIYGMTPAGQRYALPPDVEPVPGKCIVPGCDCGGVEVEE